MLNSGGPLPKRSFCGFRPLYKNTPSCHSSCWFILLVMLHRRNSFSDIANLVENKFWDTMDKTSLTKSTLLYTILNHDTAPTWHFPNPRGSFKKKVFKYSRATIWCYDSSCFQMKLNELSDPLNSFKNNLKMRLGHAMLNSSSLMPQYWMASTSFLCPFIFR